MFLEIGGKISANLYYVDKHYSICKKLSRINAGRFPQRAARIRLLKHSFALWVTFSI